MCTQILENLAKAKPGNDTDAASAAMTDPTRTSNTPPLLQNNIADVNSAINLHPSTIARDSSDVIMSDDKQLTHLDLTSGKEQEHVLIINSINNDAQMDGCDSNSNIGRASVKVGGQSTHEVTTQRFSHQVLEMALIKAGLNLHAGKIKTALHFLQVC